MRYAEMGAFNASAYGDDASYRIDIAHSIPLLILVLFSKIFEDAEVFPWIAADGAIVADFATPFVTDLKAYDFRESWTIRLSEPRAFAAQMMADMTTSFVLFHEIGHVASGHVDALAHHEGRNALLEFESYAVRLPETIERRQAWEADADAFACTLLVEYADQLMADIAVNARTKAAFGVPEFQIEHLLTIAAAGLFALFFYLRGQERHL